MYSIGIDLGGTRIKAVAVRESGQVLAEATQPTEENRGKKIWTRNVQRLVAQVEAKIGRETDSIGLAAPGLPSRDGRSIAYMPGRFQGLEGLIWRDFLKTDGPVPVLNDAQAALLGEAWLGAARRSRDIILLTLGTGVGGAAMVDGHLLRGFIGRAGHFGHISLDPNGAPDITNTPGSLEDAIGDCTIKGRSDGRFDSTAALVAASRDGDALAQGVWMKSVRALAAGIVSLINALDPQVVVIGGGIAKAGPALFRPLAQYLKRFEWRPGGQRARIVAARLEDRAGAFGAAWNAFNYSKHGPPRGGTRPT